MQDGRSTEPNGILNGRIIEFKYDYCLIPIMAAKKNSWVTIIIIFAVLFLIASIFSQAVGLLSDGSGLSAGNVAVIKVEGPVVIGEGRFFDEPVASSERIIAQIDEAELQGVKAYIFDINSPGGSGVASYEIAERIKELNVSTVAVIRDMGTSGAYWVATAADTIFANPLSMTGSIGVIGSYLDFSGLMADYNVSYERLVAGKYKDMGIPFRELTADERDILQDKLDVMHDYFIKVVAKNRGLSEKQVREFADGSYLLGSEALELGLIDRLGTPRDAVKFLEEEIGEPVLLAHFEYQTSLIDVLSSFGSTKLSLNSQNGYFGDI